MKDGASKKLTLVNSHIDEGIITNFASARIQIKVKILKITK